MSKEFGVLKLSLHDRLVGYLIGYGDGRNVVTFTDEFRLDPRRPTLSLITHPSFPNSYAVMAQPWARKNKLHPVLSNLLPEGALRELLAKHLKVHIDSEFEILAALGGDLPGALVATALAPEEIPGEILGDHGYARPVEIGGRDSEEKFSLAGIQMKFSMKQKDGRYNIQKSGELGDWIIKTPSTTHKYVPLNEYTTMSLAATIGVNTPEIDLVKVDRLDNLPSINLPDEQYAFAIKRFDRDDGERVHMEDFAQIFVKYPHEKYRSVNYEQVGKVVYEYSSDGLADIQQFARRLLANILLANGDAHLKNWSLLYPNKVAPVLSPAYDIVTTSVYIEGEEKFALNLGRSKNWYGASLDHFERWAEKTGAPWRAVKPHLNDVMARARDEWPAQLESLPMVEDHKRKLAAHWKRLHSDFRIG
jgi:serine/threonine-protein kinase HipA